jgi:DEAD/DEAH box helicase domain-containing protein
MLPLYTHQAGGKHLPGKNVMVAIKRQRQALCYNIPVMEAVVRRAAVLYIFSPRRVGPATQFTQSILSRLMEPDECATFDGIHLKRNGLKLEAGRILITNPDMLHMGVLPNHHPGRVCWAAEIYCLDETYYRGVSVHTSPAFAVAALRNYGSSRSLSFVQRPRQSRARKN